MLVKPILYTGDAYRINNRPSDQRSVSSFCVRVPHPVPSAKETPVRITSPLLTRLIPCISPFHR